MYAILKRAFDIAAASLAIAVLLPLSFPLILLLRLTAEGKVFYRQERLGRGHRPFGMLKFATMLENSEQMPGGRITVRGDPRVTPVGRVLRKTKINELPQLWNILVGDMSVIGPRPLPAASHAWYSDEVRQTLAYMRPGLSGIASIVFRDEERLVSLAGPRAVDVYRELIFPYKGELECWYYANRGFRTDMMIIALTVLAVIWPTGDFANSAFPDLPARPAALDQYNDAGR